MFSSLCARLKSFRKDDDDARIQRKAREAAKSISKTATKDLAEWEEKNGYKTTKTTTSSPSPSGSNSSTLLGKSKHSFPSMGKSSRAFPSFTRHASGDNKESSNSPQQPQVSLPDAVTDPAVATPLPESMPTFAASTDSKPPVTPCSDSKSHPDPSGDDEKLTIQKQVEEKERLLEEIQAIRKSITQLKTVDDNQESSPNLLSLNTSHLRHARAASGSPLSGQTPTTSSTVRRSAPWLTTERSSRAQSMYAASPASITSSPIDAPAVNPQRSDTVRTRTRSVADIFAEDSPAPSTSPIQRVSSAEQSPPRLQSPHDVVASGPTATPTATERPKSVTPPATHRRSTSQGAVSGSRPKSQLKMLGDVPPVPTLKKYPNASPVVEEEQTPRARPRQTAGDVSQQRQPKPRQIIDTPEEAQKRYSAALGRTRSPSAQDLKRRSVISGNLDSAHRRETTSGSGSGSSGSMTLSELQERHLAKLKQMQSPTSEKLLQEQALSLAKAEWERRTRIERQEQQRKMKERAEAERRRLVAEQQQQKRSASRPSLSVSGQEGRRSLSEEVPRGTKQSFQNGPPSPVMTAKRMSGAQKAREWRQSLASLSEETRQRALHPDSVNGGSADEFGHMRARAKSTLGLERPQRHRSANQTEGPVAGISSPALPHSSSVVAPAMAASHSHSPGGHEVFTTPMSASPGLVMPNTGQMARSLSHSPGHNHPASPPMDPSIMMAHSHSYFAAQPLAPARGRTSFNASANPCPSPTMPSMPSHKRQLTATDIRRLQEGAGPGRRPPSVVLGYEASRMPQRVG